MLERVEQGARGSSYLLDEKYSRNQLSTRNTLEIALEPLSLFSFVTVPGPHELIGSTA